MRIRNVSPLGALDLPLIGRILDPGEEFEVPDEVGQRLLEAQQQAAVVLSEHRGGGRQVPGAQTQAVRLSAHGPQRAVETQGQVARAGPFG